MAAGEKTVEFKQLGRGTAVDGRISFVNPITKKPSASDDSGYRLFCREDRGLLANLRLIQIQILRTEAASVPGMRQLRLLGRPRDPASWAAALSAARQKQQAVFLVAYPHAISSQIRIQQ
jgi:hypothetical protein